MTTEINKYHTSKIYRIISPQCEKFYIGSTTETLNRRLSKHKATYKRYLEKGLGSCMTSFEVVKFDDVIIEIIKDVNCDSKKELEKIEGDCIKEHHDRILNKRVEGRTDKEYREANKDKIKEYYEANKDIIKEKHKQYYEANKDKFNEYREANKQKINEKFNCDCGGKFTFQNKTHHNKTKQHQLFISNQS
jgi:hypothetical protein